jgi:proline dehydrogenase
MFNRFAFFFARRFVAGLDVEEAVEVVGRLNRQDIQSTLDVLGENVHEAESARLAAQSYVRTLEAIQLHQINSNVSLKLTQMGMDISRELCLENVGMICARAAQLGNFVRIDMEGSDYTARTLDIFEEVHGRFPNSGIVLQAYLHRTSDDLERMLQRGARVRLCKGAYREPPAMALQSMDAIRENYCRLTERLLLHGNYPAIATHDDFLISWTKNFVREKGIALKSFEFQMLFGIRTATQIQLAREGYNVRVYVPFGTHWLPYFYRRLRERRENVLFVLRNFFKK